MAHKYAVINSSKEKCIHICDWVFYDKAAQKIQGDELKTHFDYEVS